ncbi:hypothetical protein X975_12587, partial [Stegodyphus mimosarum]
MFGEIFINLNGRRENIASYGVFKNTERQRSIDLLGLRILKVSVLVRVSVRVLVRALLSFHLSFFEIT